MIVPYRADRLRTVGQCADVGCGACSIAWSLPMLFSDPFVQGHRFYEPFESIMPQNAWGIIALLAGLIAFAPYGRWLMGARPQPWTVRIGGGIARSMLWGALTTIGWSSNYGVPTPYISTVICATAVTGASISIALFARREQLP